MKHLFYYAIIVIVACVSTVATHATNKLTPNARLALLQNQVANKSSHQVNANADIRLVVEVDAQEAASTFEQIREMGGIVLSKLGHQAVINIPLDKVDHLVGINGIKMVDATHQADMKTDVTRVETGVSQIDGTVPGSDVAYTGQGVTICLIDKGFDFQHPAFKDENGNSRLRCVYLPHNDSGHKFIVEDDEAGTIEYPGSVFDTPELIATLTTDTELTSHGTHTTGIAAGTRSPQGYGGMAPEADIVLVSTAGNNKDIEIALQFAAQYAQLIDKPFVVNASMNSHDGPHNGTGTMPTLINEISQYVIPVFAVGNEGDQPLYIHHTFNSENSSMKAFMAKAQPSFSDDGPAYGMNSVVYGHSRNVLDENDALDLQLSIVDPTDGHVLWQTAPYTINPSQDTVVEIPSYSNEGLNEYLQNGLIVILGGANSAGELQLATVVQGVLSQNVPFTISLSSSSSIDMDLWEANQGFNTTNLPGYTNGTSEISCGDWTSTPNVISVGNYVGNTTARLFNGMVLDFSLIYTLNDINKTSSYGLTGGVAQPVVTAPGTYVTSSISHYECNMAVLAESMQWQGFPYSSLDGTSMSCPAVSGIIALWLQANPTLDLEGIKDVLAHSSRSDQFTASNPIRWGFGKIDAAAGLEYILHSSALNEVPYEQPCQVEEALWYDITGRSYRAKPTTPGIYIHAGQKIAIP